MAKFSAGDVAMTGFGVVAKRPAVLIWWILLHLLFTSATSVLLVTAAGPALTQIMALRAQHTPSDPQTQAQMLALFHQVLPFYGLMFPLMLVFYAVLYGAMNRAVLRPAKSAFGYLRLGMDEWRQVLLFLWAIVVAIGVELVLLVLGVIVAVVVGVIIAAVQKGAPAVSGGAGVAVLAPIAVGLLFMFAYIYVLVRLSLASAMTFDTGKVTLLKSWRLTKGQFWPMFGAYVLAVILSIVVSLLGMIVILICVMLAGGAGGLGFVFRPDMSSPTAFFTPARLIYIGLAGVLYALVWPILLAPSAAIYKALIVKPEPKPVSWPSPPPPLESPPGPEPFAEPPGDPTPL